LLGLDIQQLELIIKSGNEDNASPEEQQDALYAERILPLRKKGNLLLCTILLGNVAVNSQLAILMGDLTSGTMGLITSTAIITLFGEITPQATFSRHALFVGANLAWFVYIAMFLTFPISFPIAAILDKCLGEEVGNVLSKSQMKNMFEQLEASNVIKANERKIIQGALDLQEKTARQIMTEIEKVYMLEINTKLSAEILREIYQKGHSRIPIYEKDKNNIIGILMTRDLILVNPDKALLSLKQLSSIIIRDVIAVDDTDKIEPLLYYFKKGMTHIGIVTTVHDDKNKSNKDPVKKVAGIVTMEDIIEELIQDEIVDEFEQADQIN